MFALFLAFDFCCWSPAYALCAAQTNLTGKWTANDGGTYYIRQDGAAVWWVGMSADNGNSWSNVFKGTITGSAVTGQWADVPKGSARSSGTMNFTIVRSIDGSIQKLKRSAASGGFGGSEWQPACSDVISIPVP